MSIEKLTGLLEKKREALCRSYGHMKEFERLEVHKRQTELMRARRTERGDLPHEHFAYAMLMVVLQEKQEAEHAPKRRGYLDQQKLERLKSIREGYINAAKVRRAPELAAKLRHQYYHEIKEMRDQGASWRTIAEYLKHAYKLKVSHAYIRMIFQDKKEQS